VSLRFSLAGCFEIDPGVGRIILDGNNRNSGNSFILPFLYYPNDNIGFEFRPTFSTINGHSILDYEFSVRY